MEGKPRKRIIGVMGPGDADEKESALAYELGRLIAKNGWITLSGGMGGVMDSVSKGAKEAGGLTIGILPNNDPSTWSRYLDIPIVTEMGQARNCINALSSDVILAVGMNPGTASEVALGTRNGKPVILLGNSNETLSFFKKLGSEVCIANTAEEAIELITKLAEQSAGSYATAGQGAKA